MLKMTPVATGECNVHSRVQDLVRGEKVHTVLSGRYNIQLAIFGETRPALGGTDKIICWLYIPPELT